MSSHLQVTLLSEDNTVAIPVDPEERAVTTDNLPSTVKVVNVDKQARETESWYAHGQVGKLPLPPCVCILQSFNSFEM